MQSRARGATYRWPDTPKQSTRGLLEACIASRSAGPVGQIQNEPGSDPAHKYLNMARFVDGECA